MSFPPRKLRIQQLPGERVLLAGFAPTVADALRRFQALDVPPAPAPGGSPSFEVIALGHTVADELVVVIRELADAAKDATLRIIVDARTNSLIVSAPPKRLAEVRALIARLDGPPGTRNGDLGSRTFKLSHARAEDLAKVLQELLAGVPGRPAMKIVADAATNSLVVTAADERLSQIEALISRLDAR